MSNRLIISVHIKTPYKLDRPKRPMNENQATDYMEIPTKTIQKDNF